MNTQRRIVTRAFSLLLPLGLIACGDSQLPLTLAPGAGESAAVPKACAPYRGEPLAGLQHYVGLMHEHSSYSDGDPRTRPSDYYQAGLDGGFDFVAGSEHSDTYDNGLYFTLSEECIRTPDGFLSCFADPSVDKLAKWRSAGAQVAEFNDHHAGRFLAIRGFEWTSDVFGHINVYFSQNFTNAKVDGGYASMSTFWEWFTRDPEQPGAAGSPSSPTPFGGGADALAHFNHPGDKCQTRSAPVPALSRLCDWNDYTYVPEAAERLFGMELFNGGAGPDRYLPRFVRALDKGWKLSPVGSEDEHFGRFASETHPKTVTLATALSEAAFREAWLARRTYALAPGQRLRAELLADTDHPMGATLECPAGAVFESAVAVTDGQGQPQPAAFELYGSGEGQPLQRLTGATARFMVRAPEAGQSWAFVRVRDPEDDRDWAVLAPVWVTVAP